MAFVTRARLIKGTTLISIFSIVITIIFLGLGAHFTPFPTQFASCEFNMSNGFSRHEDAHSIHSDFKMCLLNVRNMTFYPFIVHQLTVMMEHTNKSFENFQVAMEMELSTHELWTREFLLLHIHHLFALRNSTFCFYPLAFFEGKCVIHK